MDRAHTVKLTKSTICTIQTIRKQIDEFNLSSEEAKIYVSDRRWQKAVYVLKTAALLSNRDEVWPIDVIILKDALWSNEEDKPIIEKIIRDAVNNIGNYSVSDYTDWKTDYGELKKETQETFRKPTKAKSVKHNNMDCYKGEGFVLRQDSGFYGGYRLIPYSPQNERLASKTKETYYFPVKDVTIGGSGVAYADVESYNFLVISIDDKGIATIQVNNQTIQVKTKVAAPVVSQRVKKAYLKEIGNFMEEIDKIISDSEKYMISRKKKLKSPFLTSTDVVGFLKKIDSVIEDMKKDRLDIESLLSSVESYETQ
jgi:MoxR-like ATPase